MGIQNYSTTPINNSTLPNITWAEGQLPSTVNNSARQMCADLAAWYGAPEWLIQADVPTYVSATQFTVPTNRTSVYSPGRAIQALVTAGTITGTITAAVYGSLTTVTVQWNSGQQLDSGLSQVAVGILQGSQGAAQMVAQLGHSPAWVNAPVVVTTAAVSGSVGTTYVLAASGIAFTLPATSNTGDEVGIIALAGSTGCTINPQSSNVRGVSGTITIDSVPMGVTLKQTNTTEGWV